MSRIRHISTTIVRPTSCDHLLTRRLIELTPWDSRLIQLDYIQKGLLFQKPAESSLIRHLKDALSRTLDIFYPLAVTENKDKTLSCFSINCNGDGAQFVHAAADGVGVADILDPVYVPEDIVSNFFSMNEILNYEEKIAHLKSKANAETGTNNISSLQALMAHHWRAITRCGHLNPDQVISYRVAVGLRQKLKAPLPKEYLGNALQGVSVKSTACELLQHGLGWAALHINKTIASLTAEEVKKILKDWEKAPSASTVPNMRNAIPTSTSTVSLLKGSSPRFNVYGNDFGWGRPVAVRSGAANKMNGKIAVFPGAEDGLILKFAFCLRLYMLWQRMQSSWRLWPHEVNPACLEAVLQIKLPIWLNIQRLRIQREIK
ncbi:uncharacterized acetyltransferase At3g50280-like [Pyrus communis]|uniref:uncharacterized acetyltransferase At3g50280-like n=1 Tax=Pyrus communis TaxID=23211 RepID=UPI0035C1E889